MKGNVLSDPRACVGDQSIDPTEAPDSLSEKAPDLGFFGEISLDDQRITTRKFAVKGLNLAAAMAVVKGEFRAFRGKFLGDSGADSAGCASNENDFLGEISVHAE
jgi:hypothetical protein